MISLSLLHTSFSKIPSDFRLLCLSILLGFCLSRFQWCSLNSYFEMSRRCSALHSLQVLLIFITSRRYFDPCLRLVMLRQIYFSFLPLDLLYTIWYMPLLQFSFCNSLFTISIFSSRKARLRALRDAQFYFISFLRPLADKSSHTYHILFPILPAARWAPAAGLYYEGLMTFYITLFPSSPQRYQYHIPPPPPPPPCLYSFRPLAAGYHILSLATRIILHFCPCHFAPLPGLEGFHWWFWFSILGRLSVTSRFIVKEAFFWLFSC